MISLPVPFLLLPLIYTVKFETADSSYGDGISYAIQPIDQGQDSQPPPALPPSLSTLPKVPRDDPPWTPLCRIHLYEYALGKKKPIHFTAAVYDGSNTLVYGNSKIAADWGSMYTIASEDLPMGYKIDIHVDWVYHMDALWRTWPLKIQIREHNTNMGFRDTNPLRGSWCQVGKWDDPVDLLGTNRQADCYWIC